MELDESIDAWLGDVRKDPPSVADLAAYASRKAMKIRTLGWTREAILLLSKMALDTTAIVRAQHEMLEHVTATAQKFTECYDQAKAAAISSAQTAMLALRRLEEQSPLCIAAVAYANGTGTLDALKRASQAYVKTVESRS